MAWFDSSWGLNSWFSATWGFFAAGPGYGTKGEGVSVCVLVERVDVVMQDVDSLDTSTISSPAGDFRIPIDSNKTFSKIISVFLMPEGSGSGFTYEVIDFNTTTGPRIKTYLSGTLSDFTVSGFIRGFKGA